MRIYCDYAMIYLRNYRRRPKIWIIDKTRNSFSISGQNSAHKFPAHLSPAFTGRENKFSAAAIPFPAITLGCIAENQMPVLVIDSIVDGTMGKCVICGKKGPLGMECSNCGEDSGGRYL